MMGRRALLPSSKKDIRNLSNKIRTRLTTLKTNKPHSGWVSASCSNRSDHLSMISSNQFEVLMELSAYEHSSKRIITLHRQEVWQTLHLSVAHWSGLKRKISLMCLLRTWKRCSYLAWLTTKWAASYPCSSTYQMECHLPSPAILESTSVTSRSVFQARDRFAKSESRRAKTGWTRFASWMRMTIRLARSRLTVGWATGTMWFSRRVSVLLAFKKSTTRSSMCVDLDLSPSNHEYQSPN